MRISSKTFSVLAACTLLVGLAVGTAGGCGSSSGSDYTSICNQACNREVTCLGAAAAAFGLTAASCQPTCAQQANTTSCPRAAALASSAQNCLAMMDCAAFVSCMQNAGDCTNSPGGGGTSGSTGGTTGTGGTSSATGGTTGTGGSASSTGGAGGHGTGGTPGGGGSSGTADCSICTTFVSSGCCASVASSQGQPAATCTALASGCSTAPSTIAPGCQSAMAQGAAANLSGCK